MKSLTPEDIQTSVLWRRQPDSFISERYPKGQAFSRVGLTLSAKGWTASIQWKGTAGARGEGKTIAEALAKAVEQAEDWGCDIVFKNN